MRNAAFSLLGSLGVGLLVTLAGCEPVDDGAATRNKGWDQVLTDHVVPGDRDIFTDTDETMTVADGCAKTQLDAHAILKDQCASCHGDPNAARGLPPWGFVLDDAMMKSETWKQQGAAPIPFIDVGHPKNSAIFIRAAISRDMPPVQRDPNEQFFERVTLSGASVLEQWITNCM
jgi:hypothetical protein